MAAAAELGQHGASARECRSARAPPTVGLVWASAMGCQCGEQALSDSSSLAAPSGKTNVVGKAVPAVTAIVAGAAVRLGNPSEPPSTNVVGEAVCSEVDLGPFKDGRVVDRAV